MSAKFTSGTWIASPEEGTTEWRVDAGTWGISICADFPGDGNVEANARLIAAAPNLLEALELFVAYDQTVNEDGLVSMEAYAKAIKAAHAAIAKATGEPQC